jgi:DDE superfamily endonuclease
VSAALPEHAAGKPLEIWFQDEARVGQQGRLTRLWAKRGTRPRAPRERPRAPRDRRYAWTYLFGAICPARAVGVGLVLPFADKAAMNRHLDEIGRSLCPEAHGALVLDRAGWHRAKRLRVPENLTLVRLPPYSPELNPMENVWEYLRENQLSLRVWSDQAAIIDSCCDTWNAPMRLPERIRSITTRTWAQTVNV